MIVKSFSINYEELINKYNIILIYGENFYLKNEILEKIYSILRGKNFKISQIQQEDLFKKINILDNYLNQNNLFDENEILIVREINDRILKYMTLKKIDKRIILVAENLPKKSVLRNTIEKEKAMSCIPCYDDDEKTLQNIMRNGLSNLKIRVSNETINRMFTINKLNRSDINSGLDKLKLIAESDKLDDEIFSSLFNTTSSFDAFEVANILLTSNKRELNKVFSNSYQFAINFNEIIGPLKYKINKLRSIYQFTENEKSIIKLIENYKPPIFWKEKNIVQIQLKIWSEKELDILLEKINQIEILCKTHYDIAETIFNKFLIDIISKRVLINTYFSH